MTRSLPALRWLTLPGSQPFVVLLVSGLLGFHLGAVEFPDWQTAVETAQVVAGLVRYPEVTPFYIYHVKLWTLLHQASAVALLAGVSEVALSKAISGLLGMLSLQAVAMVVYACSRRTWLSIATALLVYFSRIAEAGVVYPIFLLGSEHTYGILGLSLLVLIAALFGSGLVRLGGLLLGLAPALHPSLGAWLWAIAAVTLAFEYRRLGSSLGPAIKPFLAGCAVTAASLLVHLALMPALPQIAGRQSRAYLDAFVAFWDGHRQPVRLWHMGVKLNLGALVLASVWLRWWADELPPFARLMLRFVQVSACLSLALIVVSWIPPDRVPTTLLVLMPSRLLNIGVFMCAALLVGLLAAGRPSAVRAALLVVLAIDMLVGDPSTFWKLFQVRDEPLPRPGIDPFLIMALVGLALLAATAASRRFTKVESASAPAIVRVCTALTLVVMFGGGGLAWWLADDRSHLFVDRTNDGLLAAVARDSGLLLTGGDLHLIQLRTRRPVLIDGGGLDGLAYSLEAGPEMDRVLRDVYGIDLFHPPDEARWSGRIPAKANRTIWERYTADKWKAIGRTYHVTEVLTEADWLLDLPIVAQSRRFLLYRIPD